MIVSATVSMTQPGVTAVTFATASELRRCRLRPVRVHRGARDREGSFAAQLVTKRRRCSSGVDDRSRLTSGENGPSADTSRQRSYGTGQAVCSRSLIE